MNSAAFFRIMNAPIFLVLFAVEAFAFRPRPRLDADKGLFEGDMQLNPRQRELVKNGGDVSLAGKPAIVFGSTKQQQLLWLPSKTVPYVISPGLAAVPEATFAILQGFREWESYACLKLVKRTTETDYLYLEKCPGCWSYVGRQGGKQKTCISPSCYARKKVAHELGHVMGFWHEQNRPDRDQYIEILWDNIADEAMGNFNKLSNSDVDSVNAPYDYYSMMHYEETGFSKNGNITMRAKQPGIIQLGNEVGFTKIDSTQAMLLYKCNGNTTKQPFSQTTVTLKGKDDCTFESGLCHFSQAEDDDFDWTLRKGATGTYGTGPSVDHTTGRIGAFVYTESSSPRVRGDKARLVSKLLQGNKCMTIHYHMYSAVKGDMGTLNVYVKDAKSGLEQKIFTLSGSQGNEWKRKELDITRKNSSAQYTVIYEGIRGYSYQSDMALDDISFVDGSCEPSPQRDDCNFDLGICHFNQATDDNFDWTLMNGEPPSYGTGPTTDHTTKTLAGKYIYTEASPLWLGAKARLVSGLLQGNKCMTIYYHMYSSVQHDMGTLNVFVKNVNSGLEQKIFTLAGNQGNEWKKKDLEIKVQNSSTHYTIIFEGIRGYSYQSDMALDDISFVDGPCGVSATTPPPTAACKDIDDREKSYCSIWKKAGLCEVHRMDMVYICRKTCNLC